jgi:putrescine transport system permease protein
MNAGGASGFARKAALALGFLFLYGPIAILAIMSFNASRLVTVWGGFST